MVAHGVFRDDELRADERAAASLGVEAHDVRLSGSESKTFGDCGETLGLTVFAFGETRGKAGEEAQFGRLVLAHEGKGNQQHPEDDDRKRHGVKVERKHARQHKARGHGDGEQRTPAQAEHRVGRHVASLRDVCQHIPHEADGKHLRCGEDRRRQVPQRHAKEDACRQAACDDEHGGEPQAHGVACLVRLAVRTHKHDDGGGLTGQPIGEGQSEHIAHDGHGHGNAEHNEGDAQENVFENADIARAENDWPACGEFFAWFRVALSRSGGHEAEC